MASKEKAPKKKKGLVGFYKSVSKPRQKTDSAPISCRDTQYKSNISHHVLSPLHNVSLPLDPISSKKPRGLQDAGMARKSVSHVESNVFSTAEFLAMKVVAADMPGFMQAHAFRCARKTYDSLEKFSSKLIAYSLKKEFDEAYGPAWHCIVGSSFGSFVTHTRGCFLYFSMEKLYILVFRTKVQKALDV